MPQKRKEVVTKPSEPDLSPEAVSEELEVDRKEERMDKSEDAHERAKHRKRGGRYH